MADQPHPQPRSHGVVISAHGVVSLAVAGDDLVFAGQCPNRCGPLAAAAASQRCPACGYRTNVVPGQWRLV